MNPATCSHGHAGVCIDDMTAEAREAFDSGYRHAYDYAVARLDRDAAERYASWFMAQYFVDSLEDLPSHPLAMDKFRAPVVEKVEPGRGRRIDAANRAKARSAARTAARRAVRAS